MNNNEQIKRYGVKICKGDINPITRVTYLYDAVGMTPAHMDFSRGVFDFGGWADIWFVKNNYPCMLKYDGTEDYKLNPNNYALKADGTPSDIANMDYAGNAMSAIPLVWIKQYEDAEHEYIILCEKQYDEDFHAYAHTRADESIMEVKYLAMFKGSYDGTRLRSMSGDSLVHGRAQTEIDRAAANNQNGADIWRTRSWADRNLVNCLLTVISRSDDSQTVFGAGNTTSGELLKTGTLNDKGQFFGYEETDKQVKVFHIEGWWGDQWERIVGILGDYGKVKVKMIPPYNLTGEGYTDTGISWSGWNSGFIKNTVMSHLGRIPNELEQNAKHIPDWCWFDNDNINIALVGVICYYGALCGAACLSLNLAASLALWALGAALSCEQPSAA